MNDPSIGRPRFISIDEATAWHELAIREYGGLGGVRDKGLLDSALAQPRQQFSGEYVHAFPFGMAAAYAWFLAKNHPFLDGNKRAALMCCGAFLRMNGWNLTAEGTAAADVVLQLVEGSVTREEFATWLENNSHPRPSLELRDFFASLDYRVLGSMFGAIAAGPMQERLATILEAGVNIPAIHAANVGATAADAGGDTASATLLRQHAILLTAIFRIAEDMGYEW